MSCPLRQLLTVRSQAAELLLAYLKGVEQTLSRTPLLERFGHRLGEETAETVPVGRETDDDVTGTRAPRVLPRVPLRVLPSTPNSTYLPHATTSGCGYCNWEGHASGPRPMGRQSERLRDSTSLTRTCNPHQSMKARIPWAI